MPTYDIDPRLIEAARAAGIHVPERPVGDPPPAPERTAGPEPKEPPPAQYVNNHITTDLPGRSEPTLAGLLSALRDLAPKSPVAARVADALSTLNADDLAAVVLWAWQSDRDDDDTMVINVSVPNPDAAAERRAQAEARDAFKTAKAAWVEAKLADDKAGDDWLRSLAPWQRWNAFVQQARRAADAANDPQTAALAAIGRSLPPPATGKE